MIRVLLSVLAVGLISGCGAEYWTGKTTMRTEVRTPVFTFLDTKDNSIDLGQAEYDPETKRFYIKDLKVTNNASKPIAAEIDRIKAIGDAQMSQVMYLQTAMAGIGSVLERMTPVLGQAASVLAAMNPPAKRGVGVATPWGQVNLGQAVAPQPVPASQPVYPTPSPLPPPVVWPTPASQPAARPEPEAGFSLPFGAGQ